MASRRRTPTLDTVFAFTYTEGMKNLTNSTIQSASPIRGILSTAEQANWWSTLFWRA